MAAVLSGITSFLGTTPEGESIRLLNESVLNGYDRNDFGDLYHRFFCHAERSAGGGFG